MHAAASRASRATEIVVVAEQSDTAAHSLHAQQDHAKDARNLTAAFLHIVHNDLQVISPEKLAQSPTNAVFS